MAPPVLEPDAWYRLYFQNNEGAHYLTTHPNGTSIASQNQTIYNLWQVLTDGDGYFTVRQNRSQVDWWQLGTYIDQLGGLAPDTKTQIQIITNDTSQQWNIDQWTGDSEYFKISNVELGEAALDCRADNERIFMQSQPQTTLVNERWYFTSVTKIAEPTATRTTGPTSTATSTGTITSLPTSSSYPDPGEGSPGLSTGATAGITVGVSLVGSLVLALVCIFVWRRKKKAKEQGGRRDSVKHLSSYGSYGNRAYHKQELPGHDMSGLQSSRSVQLSELQSTPDIEPTELPTDPVTKRAIL